MSKGLIYQFHLEALAAEGFTFLDIGNKKKYFDEKKTQAQLKKDLTKKVIPLIKKLEKNSDLKATCYFSGPYLAQIGQNLPLLKRIKALIKNEKIELIGGTYYFSISSLISAKLFLEEIKKHRELIKATFGISPKGFLNTAAIYSGDLSEVLEKINFDYIICPHIAWFQADDKNQVVFTNHQKNKSLLLVHSQKDKALDYEVVWDDNKNEYLTCSQIIQKQKRKKVYNILETVSLIHNHHDISSFIGNALQKQVFSKSRKLSKFNLIKRKEIVWDLLKLSDITHYFQLGYDIEYKKRYQNYVFLMDCLTDIELRIIEGNKK